MTCQAEQIQSFGGYVHTRFARARAFKDSSMNTITRGMVAGLVATILLSAIMMGEFAMRVMPALDPVCMIANIISTSMAMGWVIHFMIGTIIWGDPFAGVHKVLSGSQPWIKGAIFGVGASLLMMVAVMPMTGAGLFGMQMGMMAPVMTLVLHLIYGAVLGAVYGAVPSNTATVAQ
jgi:hypothetical protein